MWTINQNCNFLLHFPKRLPLFTKYPWQHTKKWKTHTSKNEAGGYFRYFFTGFISGVCHKRAFDQLHFGSEEMALAGIRCQLCRSFVKEQKQPSQIEMCRCWPSNIFTFFDNKGQDGLRHACTWGPNKVLAGVWGLKLGRGSLKHFKRYHPFWRARATLRPSMLSLSPTYHAHQAHAHQSLLAKVFSKLRTEDWGLRTEDWGLRTEDWGLRTEDWVSHW